MSSDFCCPKCGEDLWNPCESGCCQAGYCKECDVVYGLHVMSGQAGLYYRTLACKDCHLEIDAGLCSKHTQEEKMVKEGKL